MGELDRASVQYKSASELFRAVQDWQACGFCTGALGEVARRQGKLDEALEAYHVFGTAMEELGHTVGVAQAWTNIGWTHLWRLDRDAARGAFSRALDIADSTGPIAAPIYAGLAMALDWRSERPFGLQTLARARESAQGQVKDSDVVGTLRRLEEVWGTQGWPERQTLETGFGISQPQDER